MKVFKFKTVDHKTVYVKIDDADAYLLRGTSWCVNNRTVSRTVSKEKRMLSHEILNPPKGSFIEHKNGDPFDYRRANLHVAGSLKEHLAWIWADTGVGLVHLDTVWGCGHKKDRNYPVYCPVCKSENGKKNYRKRKEAAR